jgi:hypothetical protein
MTHRATFWCLLLVFIAISALAPGVGAATYYVSATGDDAHSGTDSEAPWKSLDKVNATTFQPGDRILFKSGEEWKGVLHPKGSGTKDGWITLDCYGSGAKPLFRGADKTEIIDLQGQQYWIIQNLATTGGRTGVNIGSNGVNKPADMHGIRLLNLDVSETTGGGEAAILIRPSTAAMDDVLIEGCSIRNVVAGAAIWVHNTVADPVDKVEDYCMRVVIRENRIDGASDNGIIVSQSADPLIEGNTVYRCGAYRHTGDGAFAGIFPTYSRSAVIQRNEIGYTAGVPAGGDSHALSCDQFNSGAILFQYNYTHDNAGGFLLTTPEAFAKDPKGRCVVRYNISQNDGNVVSPAEGGGTFRIQGKRTTVYNNVFFNDKGPIYVQRWYGDNKGEAAFYNNIFSCPKGFDSNANNNKQGMGSPDTLIYDRNVFYGSPGPKEDAHQIRRDPLFVDPGSGGKGLETLKGYRIREGSPCIGVGAAMPENGGRDFFGNRLPEGRLDIGPHQFRLAQAPEPTTDVTLSPFGIGSCHANNWSAQANARWIPQMTAIGVTNHRTCNTGWSAVEPEEGKWTWDVLDKQMKYLEDQHIAFGGILAGSPKWNTKDQPDTLPVNNLPAWSNYVSEVVKHSKGRIKSWEVWNEPPNGTGRDQTAADYAKLVIAAYDAAKTADPECKIGIAAKSVAINYLDQAIAAGAKGHFDYVTLHPYEVAGCTITHPGAEVVYLQIAGTLRKMLAARDPAKVNCPIIFTELGFAADGQYSHKFDNFSSLEVQGHAVVKYYTMGIAQGIACIQWFEGMDGDSGPMGLLAGKGEKRPAYTALALMIKYFGQHPTYLGWVLLNDKHYGFVFQGDKGTVLATWASSTATDKVDFGQQVQIVDPLTGKVIKATTHKLTIAPILVVGVPDNLVKQAKGNKAKPFPWGGDFTDAKSVSVSMGEKNVEKGLHTQSAESIAKDVIAYGGSARSGGVPGGNVFMADPNFLSYTSTPIEISIVVRRNEDNDNAGFKLVYESTSGYKDLGWYTVPDNKEWHTVKWKITDAQFVGMWGYNFLLNSDGNTYNKYYIQSVTVTKLDKK